MSPDVQERWWSQALAEGERLVLRLPQPSDEAAWVAVRRASASFHAPWEPRPEPGEDPCGPEAFRRLVADALTDRNVRMLSVRRDDGAIVGQVNLNEIVGGCFRSAYLGYWVGAPFARRGHGRETVALAIDLAFDVMELHRVEANVQPTNAASLALVRSLGFRREGFSPGYLKIAGRWEDHERWALTVEDRRR
jgi:ribosomal-protein-alanine N-acetyltransferase